MQSIFVLHKKQRYLWNFYQDYWSHPDPSIKIDWWNAYFSLSKYIFSSRMQMQIHTKNFHNFFFSVLAFKIKSSQSGYLTRDKIQKQNCKCFLHFVDFIAFPLQFWIFQMPAQFDTKCDIITLCQLHTLKFLIRELNTFLILFWNFPYLHGLIRTYTFIYFWEKFPPTWLSGLHTC